MYILKVLLDSIVRLGFEEFGSAESIFYVEKVNVTSF